MAWWISQYQRFVAVALVLPLQIGTSARWRIACGLVCVACSHYLFKHILAWARHKQTVADIGMVLGRGGSLWSPRGVRKREEICSAATSPEPLNDHRHQIQHDAPAADRLGSPESSAADDLADLAPDLCHELHVEEESSSSSPSLRRQEPEPEREPLQGKRTSGRRLKSLQKSRSVNFEQLHSQVKELDFEPLPGDAQGNYRGKDHNLCRSASNLDGWSRKPSSQQMLTPKLTESRREVQNSITKVHELELELEIHLEELSKLQLKLKSLSASITGEADPGVEAFQQECRALSSAVEGLGARALEGSCYDRNMMGAMAVFQRGNAVVDAVAELLKQLAQAASEADAPAACDGKEWRIVKESIGSVEELKALRELLERVANRDSHDVPREGILGKDAICGGDVPLACQPAVLLRFLRAQEGRVNDAAQMFVASEQWRESYSLDRQWAEWCAEIAAQTTWRSQLVERFKVHASLGKDRFGVDAYIFRWGVFDIAGAERELGHEMVLKIMLFIHEDIATSMRAAMFQRDAFCPGTLYVWDIGDYSRYGGPSQWWKRMMSLMRFLPKVAGLLAANYPEVVRKIMVVRAGMTARTLHHAVAAVLPAKTLSKVRLYGWYSEEWRHELLEEVPNRNALPEFLLCDDAAALTTAEPCGGWYPKP
mmetsp:Transcript_40217/g.92453  ORF Transcript_40217/g.92453 Transcript_40217/m.92453 type:complete len:656 (+) Transcript_40217:33-2000(+)